MKSKTTRHGLKRMTALLLAVVLCVGMVPTAFAAQQDSYHDPAENWQEANNRTNELDANATVTHETFNCKVCKQQTSFIVFRTPEYTRDGQTAMSRNVKYSDGTFVDGSGKGSILDGVPGQDAYYTAYHWTKAVCETCGSINTNMAKTDYGYLKNVYWLYDCANNFFEELPETQTIEQADSEYHRVITTSGEYCGFCYGTFKEENSTLERHHMENAIRPELAHDRFVEMDTCADCGYAETSYTAAKAVIADYFGVVDGQPHTVTVSDLSEAGVTTAIRYGHSADACTLTSAPNYATCRRSPVFRQNCTWEWGQAGRDCIAHAAKGGACPRCRPPAKRETQNTCHKGGRPWQGRAPRKAGCRLLQAGGKNSGPCWEGCGPDGAWGHPCRPERQSSPCGTANGPVPAGGKTGGECGEKGRCQGWKRPAGHLCRRQEPDRRCGCGRICRPCPVGPDLCRRPVNRLPLWYPVRQRAC